MKSKLITAEQVDAILPQTQCGLCSYKGCMPYAEALANQQAEINLCPPGGVKGLLALGELLNKDPTPFIAEMETKAKPSLRAVIREAECIGCTKCIKACPVDAIIGSGKLMHSVITDECTGCELCVAPCPVDCIDMVTIVDKPEAIVPDMSKANQYRKRYQAREQRLKHAKPQPAFIKENQALDTKKAYLAAALERAKQKRKI